MSEIVLGEHPVEASSGGPSALQRNGHPSGMFGQGAALPWTTACPCQEEGMGVPSPLRTTGATPVSSKDAPHDLRGVAPHRRGLEPPGYGGATLCHIWLITTKTACSYALVKIGGISMAHVKKFPPLWTAPPPPL